MESLELNVVDAIKIGNALLVRSQYVEFHPPCYEGGVATVTFRSENLEMVNDILNCINYSAVESSAKKVA